jgi:hypothetical protein
MVSLRHFPEAVGFAQEGLGRSANEKATLPAREEWPFFV